MITLLPLLAALALAQDVAEGEEPPEQRFRIIAVSSDPPAPEADPYAAAAAESAEAVDTLAAPAPPPGSPLLNPADLDALMLQIASGQLPALDPAALQNPEALLQQLPPELRATIEAAQQQATEQAEDAAREAGESVRALLEQN